MSILLTEKADARSLIDNHLFNRLASRIEAENLLDRGQSEAIVEQTIAFLSACAANTGARLAPSELVDIGWHTFILHTRDYATFCDRIADRFLHHVPTDPDDPSARGQAARDTLQRTMTAIEEAGFSVNADLWQPPAATKCTPCKNGCADDPPPPPRAGVGGGLHRWPAAPGRNSPQPCAPRSSDRPGP